MWLFITGAWLGGIIGVVIMCLFQLNTEEFKEEK